MDLQRMETQMMARMSEAIARGDFAQGGDWDFVFFVLAVVAGLLLAFRDDFFPVEKSDREYRVVRMRRRTLGEWEYREMTQDEYDDWLDRNAW